jgi:ribose/xylose/arabinose/galactoside ABC-type transport system permease subunit
VALNSGYSLPVSILFALSIGALAGAFNGFLVVGLRIPAIVATLGTLGLYRGAMLLWTGGKWIEGLPPGLKSSLSLRPSACRPRHGGVDYRGHRRVDAVAHRVRA